METIQRCPKCGSIMVLRTAKSGPYAGKQFYGCQRYPTCKHVVSYAPDNKEKNAEQGKRGKEKGDIPFGTFNCTTCGKEFRTKNGLDWHTSKFHFNKINNSDSLTPDCDTQVIFPRNLSSREKYSGYQVRFIESAALPSELIEKIVYDGGDPNYLKAFSQWRLDFPQSPRKPQFSDVVQQVLAVAEKILNRGKLVLTSPKLEKTFMCLFFGENDYKPDFESLYLAATVQYENQSNDFWLDSPQEAKFYKTIFPKLISDNYQFVIPQIEMTSLITDDITHIDRRRPDFGIFHPASAIKFIVEIDGQGHTNRKDIDNERNKLLEKGGFRVIRVPAGDIDNIENSSNLNELSHMCKELFKSEQTEGCKEHLTLNEKYLLSCKIAHQIQFTLLQSIVFGFLDIQKLSDWRICSDLDQLGLFSPSESRVILSEAVNDFIELISEIMSLYNVDTINDVVTSYISAECQSQPIGNNSLNIAFTGFPLPASTTFYIQNIYFPWHITNAFLTVSPLNWMESIPEERTLRFFLNYIFRKNEFWEGQYQSIIRALQGKDSLILLPTGGGKSLVYQLASLLLPGRTLVIDPIISLMEDQIANLAHLGIDRCKSITGISDAAERKTLSEMFAFGEYLFTFISPERLQIEDFRNSLKGLTTHTPVSIVVIDEAHCVSEWGHDFRTSYLNIGRTAREFSVSNNKPPVLLALTGTASRSVLKDVQRELQIESFDAIITPKSFDRKELLFYSEQVSSAEKRVVLKTYLTKKIPSFFNITSNSLYQLRGRNTWAGLIFCPWVGGEFGVVEVSTDINKSLGIHTDFYSGSQPKQYTDERYNDKKTKVANEFRRNRLCLLVCTKSFGMGIDKPNIRYTLHVNLPGSIESFYQEAGRAGRDRQTAYCTILVSNDDQHRTEKLLDPSTSVEQIAKELKDVSWENNDDITRILYFHIRAFRGIETEKSDIKDVLMQLGNIHKSEKISITIPVGIKKRAINNKGTDTNKDARSATEKALHRLLILGVINDYTIDYANNVFRIVKTNGGKQFIANSYLNYVGGYLQSRKESESQKISIYMAQPLEEFILSMADTLLRFIYDVIENGRRRALLEMLECANAKDDRLIRERINRYLEWTRFSENLETIINAKEISFVPVKDLIGNLISPNDASELRGQVARYLESYPDHPILLMLRAMSELQSNDANNIIAKQNIIAGIASAINKYAVLQEDVYDIAVWALDRVIEFNRESVQPLIIDLLREIPYDDFARNIIQQLGKNYAGTPAWFLLSNRNNDCQTIIDKFAVKK